MNMLWVSKTSLPYTNLIFPPYPNCRKNQSNIKNNGFQQSDLGGNHVTPFLTMINFPQILHYGLGLDCHPCPENTLQIHIFPQKHLCGLGQNLPLLINSNTFQSSNNFTQTYYQITSPHCPLILPPHHINQHSTSLSVTNHYHYHLVTTTCKPPSRFKQICPVIVILCSLLNHIDFESVQC